SKVLAAVREGTGVSKTMLYRVTKNNMRVDVLDALLVDLERDGMVTTKTVEPSEQNRLMRPCTYYYPAQTGGDA
ncbi:hypothetical protein ABK046_49875, partial [Streptomyces caeruleatus]